MRVPHLFIYLFIYVPSFTFSSSKQECRTSDLWRVTPDYVEDQH